MDSGDFSELLQEKLEKIADLCEKTIDLDALIQVASIAEPISYTPMKFSKMPAIKIAVAKDEAFCFYYKDTLQLLTNMGAELTFFSPLANEPIPKDADGFLLGRGYLRESHHCRGVLCQRGLILPSNSGHAAK